MAVMTREQARAARAVRGWNLRELASALAVHFGAAAVTFASVNRFERGAADARGETLRQLHKVYEAEGLRFSNGDNPGVSWDAGARDRWAAADKPKPAKAKRKAKRSSR